MDVRRAPGRRIALALTAMAVCTGVGLAAAPVAGATPAVAASQPAGAGTVVRTRTAAANWMVPGPVAANVSLQATEAGGSRLTSLSFFVSEQFCDATTGQEVFRSFGAQTPPPLTLFSVERGLAGAVLIAGGLQVHGTEQRVQGCTTAPVSPPSGLLATSRVLLAVTWQATGPAGPGQPGVVVRAATATGLELSGGPLRLGGLGPVSFAQLRRSTGTAGT